MREVSQAMSKLTTLRLSVPNGKLADLACNVSMHGGGGGGGVC